jgi:hypothetical protein
MITQSTNEPLGETLPQATKLRKYFVTFGQKYRTEEHPTLKEAHPDGVVEVPAINSDVAREIVVDKLGDKWCAIYSEDEIDLNHYPRGVIAIL